MSNLYSLAYTQPEAYEDQTCTQVGNPEQFLQELREEYLEENIDLDDLEDTKADCIIRKIINGTLLAEGTSGISNSLVSKLLYYFSKDGYDLKIQFDIFEMDKKAKTAKNMTPITSKEFIIYLNENHFGQNHQYKNLKLVKTVIHELMHANMLADLDNWGLLHWEYYNGYGINANLINTLCYDSTSIPLAVPNFALFSALEGEELNRAEKFAKHYCQWLIEVNNGSTLNWAHEIFNTWDINFETYRNQLKDYIKGYLQYDNTDGFQQEFGQNWKEKIAEVYSWDGLKATYEFMNNYVVPNPDYQYLFDQFPNYINNEQENLELKQNISSKYNIEIQTIDYYSLNNIECP